MENFSPANQAEKMSRLHEIFQPGLKLKSEVNPVWNLSVGFFVLAICIFPRGNFHHVIASSAFLSILSEGRAEISARAEILRVISP